MPSAKVEFVKVRSIYGLRKKEVQSRDQQRTQILKILVNKIVKERRSCHEYEK
jgi:hypothetical protein